MHIVQKFLLLSLVSLLMLAATSSAFGAAATSTNWAGYVITSTGMTAISASWTVPAVQCTISGPTNTVTQGLGVWIGLDGVSNNAVPEQIGTISECWNGSPNYWSWEEDPSISSNTKTNHALTAIPDTSAGDQITASIAYLSNSEYQLSLKDSTSDESRTFTVFIHNAPRGSAEWILEAFSNINTGKQMTLPTFKPFTFSDCSASVNNVAGSIIQNNGQPLDMVDNNNNIIVQPQNLNQAGTSFQIAAVGQTVPEAPSVLWLFIPTFLAVIYILRKRKTDGTDKPPM